TAHLTSESYSPAMTERTEVSIWTTEFRAGRLPPICVKSGRSADSKLKFRFSTVTRPWYSMPVGITVGLLTRDLFVRDLVSTLHRAAGWLPVTRRWLTMFIVFLARLSGVAESCYVASV